MLGCLVKLYKEWRERVPVQPLCCLACKTHNSVCHEQGTISHHYCSSRCQDHYYTLLGHKRVLDLTLDLNQWTQLPPEIVVALLEVSFPLRETDAGQFRELAQFRSIDERFRVIIDEQIFSHMHQLPEEIESELTDTTLTPFIGLQRLSPPDSITDFALGRLTNLTQLQLTNHGQTYLRHPPITAASWGLLPRLKVLDLWHYHRPLSHDWCELYANQLESLAIASDQWALEDANDVLLLTGLTQLYLEQASRIDGTVLRQMTRLESLHLEENHIGIVFGNGSVETLTNLTRLQLINTRGITGEVLNSLVNLQHLELEQQPGNLQFINQQVTQLPELRSLKLVACHGIDNLTGLSLLTRLVMQSMDFVNSGLVTLTQLERLELHNVVGINDHLMPHLLNLRHLGLAGAYISSEGLKVGLTALHTLDLPGYEELDAYSFIDAYKWLPALRSLNLAGNWVVKPDQVLYNVWRNERMIPRTLADHLPIGCYVYISYNEAFRVVDRNDGKAEIITFKPHKEAATL